MHDCHTWVSASSTQETAATRVNKAHRHDGQCTAEVGGVLQQALALVQGLKDKLELPIVQVEHRLLQIPHAPMH